MAKAIAVATGSKGHNSNNNSNSNRYTSAQKGSIAETQRIGDACSGLVFGGNFNAAYGGGYLPSNEAAAQQSSSATTTAGAVAVEFSTTAEFLLIAGQSAVIHITVHSMSS